MEPPSLPSYNGIKPLNCKAIGLTGNPYHLHEYE